MGEGGLVRVRPQGNQRYYRAVPEALGELRAYLKSYWSDRLSRLKDEAELEARRERRDARQLRLHPREWHRRQPGVGVSVLYTDAALLQRWLCVQARIDLRPGGGYAFNVTGSHTTRGTFLVVEPSRRLVYTWLFDHVEPPLPTTMEVTFTPVGRGTRVRLRHHGFVDQPTSDRHAAGWAHYLPRLAAAAAGGEPGADDWRTASRLSGGA